MSAEVPSLAQDTKALSSWIPAERSRNVPLDIHRVLPFIHFANWSLIRGWGLLVWAALVFRVFSLYTYIYILFPLCGGTWRLNELFVCSYVAVVLQLCESTSAVPPEHQAMQDGSQGSQATFAHPIRPVLDSAIFGYILRERHWLNMARMML